MTKISSLLVLLVTAGIATAGPAKIRTAKPSDDVLKKELTTLQYEVTQNNGTERPFQNEFHNTYGAYKPLFLAKR